MIETINQVPVSGGHFNSNAVVGSHFVQSLESLGINPDSAIPTNEITLQQNM